MSATACLARPSVPAGRSRSVGLSARADDRDRARELAAALGRCRQLPRGSHLFRAGDSLGNLYMVSAGSLKVYATSLDGDEQVLGFFLREDVLGLEAISSRHHAYSAIALERTDVIELTLEQLQAEAGTVPRSGEPGLLQQLCCDAIAGDYAARRARSPKFAEQRLSLFLVNLWDRLDANARARGELSLTMSRRDIGNYLGMALETVSRLLSQLERRNVLQVRRRSVRVLDADVLRRVAGNQLVTTRSRKPLSGHAFEHHTGIAG